MRNITAAAASDHASGTPAASTSATVAAMLASSSTIEATVGRYTMRDRP